VNWEIILGPPGTGKTTKLIEILRQELARGTPPDRIGFVTFTRKAAAEALDRVKEEFGLESGDFPHFRTLHSLCMRFGGLAGGNILQGPKVREFADWIGVKITGRLSVDGVWSGYEIGDRMMFMDGVARIRRIPLRKLYEQDHDELDWAVLERFSRGLEEYKKTHHLYDFTDMLELFVKRGARPNIEVLLVDEAQDLSILQWDVVRELATNCRRVVVAGDDDQAIFIWAGADVDTLIDLPGDVTVLGQSWRVPKRVQAVANDIIGRVHRRRDKKWNPREEDGIVRHLANIDEVDLSGDSIMILARNRHQLDPVERSLRAAGVLYEREGNPSVSRATLDRIVTWERLRRGEKQRAKDVVAAYELFSVGVGVARGHKKLPFYQPEDMVGMNDLMNNGGLLRNEVWHVSMDKITLEDRVYLMRCRRNKERLTIEPRIKLSTIHGSKGGQADRVALMTDMAPRTWRETHTDPDAEARVFYVGATRAKQELCVIAPTTPRHYPI